MSITIKHKKSAVASAKPTGAQIDNGEIAVNYSDTDPALYIKDSTGAVIRIAGSGAVGGMTSSAVAPTTPADGDTWVDTSVHPPSMKVWDATTSKWEVIGSSGSGTAPTSPATGAVWVDTSAVPNVIKVWDGGNWVSQAGATITASVAPTAPATGQVWVDTSASPSPIRIWDGSSWVTTAATGAASQTLANDAKYATKAEVQAEDLWDRTGTEIHPKTAGDDVFTSGDVKVGGTTGTPKISLKADGSAEFTKSASIGKPNAGQTYDLGVRADVPTLMIRGDSVSEPASLVFLPRDGASSNRTMSVAGKDKDLTFNIASTSNNTSVVERMRLTNTGDIKIGGTLPASPNIKLNAANGSAEFAYNVAVGNIDLAGSGTSGSLVQSNGTIKLVKPNANEAFTVYNKTTKNVSISADGSAEFVGNVKAKVLLADSSNPSTLVQLKQTNGTYNLESTAGDFRIFAGTGSTGEKLRVKNSGDVLIGGALPASPNISLKADGSAKFAGGKFTVGNVGQTVIDMPNPNTLTLKRTGVGNNIGLSFGDSSNGVRTGLGINSDFCITTLGGNLAASPSISLKADGSAKFTGQLTASKAGTGEVKFTGSSSTWAQQVTGSLGSRVIGLAWDGSAEFVGDIRMGGTLPASPNISLKADGNIRAVGLAAAGRVYADNATAKAGGLVDGDFYRKADGTLMVAYT